VPGAYLHEKVEQRWPEARVVTRAMASHIGPALLGGLTCLLFALLCRDLGVSQLASNLSALGLAFATMVAVYARSSLSEISQVAAFTGFFLWLLRVANRATIGSALALGLWAGLLVNTKVIFALALPGAALFAGWIIYRSHGPQRLLRTLCWTTLAGLPGIVTLLTYNYVRTGSATNTGYALPHQAGPSFSENPLVGFMGFFFSPGKSMFLYSPPLILSLLALPHLLRTRSRRWFWASLLTVGPVVYVNCKLMFWSGDWCWGPRYLLFMVPVTLVPAAFFLERLLTRGAARQRYLKGAACGSVFALGIGVQLLGGLMYWDHFIRLAQDVRTQWLGSPNRSGAAIRAGGAHCDPCFEDYYAFNWLPPLSPIEGHYWLIRSVKRGLTWQEAEAQAPWHRYTTVKMFFPGNYGRARLDWWYLDWEGPLRPAARRLLLIMVLGTALSGFLWWYHYRSGIRLCRPRRHAGAAPGDAKTD
jgi:hypothetical protein